MNLALFDFDGTLTTRETFGDFMRHAVTPLRRALGAPLFAPMLAGYKLGLVSEPVQSLPVARAGSCLRAGQGRVKEWTSVHN
jgi:hypothetical protein